MYSQSASNRLQVEEFAHDIKLKSLEELLFFPKFFSIETVSLCNARCIMCPIEEWKREENLMSDELFKTILRELSDYSDWVEMVTIQLDGEPLIDKKIESRISALKEIGIKFVTFSSNASLWNRKRCISILESGIDEISFSIDGSTKETFELIRKPLKFETCINNIKQLIEVRQELGYSTPIRIRMTIMDKNVHEFKSFMEFWNQHLASQDQCYGKLIHNWGNWTVGHYLPETAGREELNKSACIAPFGTMVILTDGRVPLCCCDFNAKVELGRVGQSSIREIWQSAKIQQIRNKHLTNGRESMKMCIDCNSWDPSSKITTI